MTVDWKGKGGTVSEGAEFEKLDTSHEYVLQLIETDYAESVEIRFKDECQIHDRFKTVWQVEGHKTRVWQAFNLPVGFLTGSVSVSERSNVVKFAKRFRPIDPGKPFHLDDHFVEKMRVRAYLKKQERSDYYNIDLDTVVPYSVRAAGSEPPTTEKIQGLKKLVQLYPQRDEAWTAFKEVVGDDPALFSMVWDTIQSEKGKIITA